MKYETIEHLQSIDFQRLTEVQRETFEEMLQVIEKGWRDVGLEAMLWYVAAFGWPNQWRESGGVSATVSTILPCTFACSISS